MRALRESAEQKSYLPVRGLAELNEAVVEHHRREFGIDREPDDVLIGPGSKELMFLLQLVYYGELVIPSPSWVSYAPQAQIIGRSIRWIRTRYENDWLIEPEQFNELCSEAPDQPRLMILNYPSNPTGRTYPEAQLKDLADEARAKAVAAFQEGPEIRAYLHDERRILKALGNEIARRLGACRVRVLPPRGGFYLFPDFSPASERLDARGIDTDRELCERLLEETGVAMLPGSDFGRDPGELTARLAYVDFDGATALDAARDVPRDRPLDLSFLEAYCDRMLEAADRIVSFINRSG